MSTLKLPYLFTQYTVEGINKKERMKIHYSGPGAWLGERVRCLDLVFELQSLDYINSAICFKLCI